MKIMYVNCGVKSHMNEDHCSYIRNFCSCEKKAGKKTKTKTKKKKVASTGFEPSTIVIPVQRSTNLS